MTHDQKPGNAPATAHQEAEAKRAKQKQEHEASKTHHKRFMTVLRSLDAALK